jgi:regulator of protease activity HflC (stomatin/prohibitin superfamily)
MPDTSPLPIALIIFFAVALFLLSGFRIAQQYDRGVVFRLGWFSGIRGPGLYYLIPLIEWQRKIDTRTVTVAVEQQETITRDSVTVKVNAVLWFRVVDPAKAVLSVENYNMAIYQVALTGLRNIIGQHDLDEVLKERDKINGILKASLNELSAPWGTTVEIVEMKDVEIPLNMQRVMAMEAEREARAHHQGKRGTRGLRKTGAGRPAHDGHARFAGAAAHADGFRGRGGE